MVKGFNEAKQREHSKLLKTIQIHIMMIMINQLQFCKHYNGKETRNNLRGKVKFSEFLEQDGKI